ncbi:MAG: hypothetical protein ACFFAN_19420 [Promethearchaeota archaeon]
MSENNNQTLKKNPLRHYSPMSSILEEWRYHPFEMIPKIKDSDEKSNDNSEISMNTLGLNPKLEKL